jgi:hypothetical protein
VAVTVSVLQETGPALHDLVKNFTLKFIKIVCTGQSLTLFAQLDVQT